MEATQALKDFLEDLATTLHYEPVEVVLTDDTSAASTDDGEVYIATDISGMFDIELEPLEELSIIVTILHHELEHLRQSNLNQKQDVFADFKGDGVQKGKLAAYLMNVFEDRYIDTTRHYRRPGMRGRTARMNEHAMQANFSPIEEYSHDANALSAATLMMCLCGRVKGDLEQVSDKLRGAMYDIKPYIEAITFTHDSEERRELVEHVVTVFERFLGDLPDPETLNDQLQKNPTTSTNNTDTTETQRKQLEKDGTDKASSDQSAEGGEKQRSDSAGESTDSQQQANPDSETEGDTSNEQADTDQSSSSNGSEGTADDADERDNPSGDSEATDTPNSGNEPEGSTQSSNSSTPTGEEGEDDSDNSSSSEATPTDDERAGGSATSEMEDQQTTDNTPPTATDSQTEAESQSQDNESLSPNTDSGGPDETSIQLDRDADGGGMEQTQAWNGASEDTATDPSRRDKRLLSELRRRREHHERASEEGSLLKAKKERDKKIDSTSKRLSQVYNEKFHYLRREFERAFEQMESGRDTIAVNAGERFNMRRFNEFKSGNKSQTEWFDEDLTQSSRDRLVFVVLDSSASMSSLAAMRALAAVADVVTSRDDNFASIGFTTRADENTYLITAPDEPFHRNHVSAVRERGCTPTPHALEKSIDMVQQADADETFMVVVTDGKANRSIESDDAVEESAQLVQQANQMRDTVCMGLGVGKISDEQMNQQFGDNYVTTGMNNIARPIIRTYMQILA